MKRTIKETADGSKTLLVESLQETYHSHNGALAEARHVFIQNGIAKKQNLPQLSILEFGFGTGLNVLVTQEYLQTNQTQKVNYYSLEKYPIPAEQAQELGYEDCFENAEIKESCQKIHLAPWEKTFVVNKQLTLHKVKCDFYELPKLGLPKVDIIYFDCFGARVQPDLWEEKMLSNAYHQLNTGGLFTTYSSKGSMRRILESLGMHVEKVPGPIGKREMIIAWKPEK